MPLNSTSHPAQRTSGGVLFPMIASDGGMVGIIVLDEALESLEGSALRLDEEYVSSCETHRARLERIARAKFEEGEHGGSVNISAIDVVQG